MQYRPEDQAVLEALFAEAWRSVWHGLDFENAHADLRRIRSAYQAGGGEFWLLRFGDHVVGSVAMKRLDPETGELKRLNVLPDHRRRGHGRRLIQRALEHAVAMGVEHVRLDTIRKPGPALHLFEALGFYEIPRYNDNPYADVFMELRVRDAVMPRP